MYEKQTVCLRRLGGSRAGEMKLGRWFANKEVSQKELIENITNIVCPFVKERHVLGIQDTTEINYQAHCKRIQKGLGPVGNGRDLGFFMHPMLVLDAEEGTCLGLSAIKIWTRKEEEKENYKKLPIEKKESYRWIEVAQTSKEVLKQAKTITIIADRESDIYEEWARIPDEKTHLITRACRDRKLVNGQTLFKYIESLKVCGLYEIELPKRVGKRSAHKACLEIRMGEIEIKKPGNCLDKMAPSSIKLRIVDVKEKQETVVGGEEAIHWCLLTTHETSTKEEALQIVCWYCMRWNVEQLFRTLKKQGLDIESSQMETGAGLMKLGIVALGVALRTMQLTLAREGKDQVVSVIFNEEECQVLSKLQIKLEGKTIKQKNPHSSDRLSWAAWIIARLGGWNGYPSESPPGPITMLRGLKQFQSILEGVHLANLCA